MPNYRRYDAANHSIFITLVTADRKPLLVQHYALLRQSFLLVKQRHPFQLSAMIVLPDHCHCILQLPDLDTNFSTRISLIKSAFSRNLPNLEEKFSASRTNRRERRIWQRRFWEHTLRNEADFQRHFDYIHYNPVKHGYVQRCKDWPHSTFHRYVKEGVYPEDWGSESAPIDINAGE